MNAAAPPQVPSCDTAAPGAWQAVWAMALGVAGLIVAEFLPAGLLTPMARTFGITEGAAGQAVTATSVVAVLASLGIAYATQRHDRRRVLLGLSALLVLANGMVALAPSYAVLLVGRLVLGVALGGFWSMTTAVAARLVPPDQLGRALSIIFGASSFAAVLAAPLGSCLGDVMGWRNVFFFAAGLAACAWLAQWHAIPALPPRGTVRPGAMLEVLAMPQVAAALGAVMLAFGARFGSFTYLRPFLERSGCFAGIWVAGALFVFDFGNFVGNLFAPGMIRRDLLGALRGPPLLLAALSLALLAWGTTFWGILGLLLCWGAGFGPIPPAWSTWIARRAPQQAETAGGLYVAAVQLAAALGAGAGGMAFDWRGPPAVFVLCGAAWLLSAAVVHGALGAPAPAADAGRAPG